tara:strand:- start:5808 stop:6707 length:900 start_codon:yes stop_codon:yes gene_type:complete
MIGHNVAARESIPSSTESPINWCGRGFSFTFPRPAIVMGVLNVTPDSFSDGGKFTDLEAATTQAKRMIDGGAEIIDVGGESTRPGAELVSTPEEIDRVVPSIEKICAEFDVLVSIDTQKPDVAQAALAAGASIVNDIASNREDTEMWKLVARKNAGYIAMHMQGNPQTMQDSPAYEDVVAEVQAFFEDRLQKLAKTGVSIEQVVFDVGIGFGKTLEHNLQLLGGLSMFTTLKRPQLLGVSRKSLFGKLLDLDVDRRLPPGLACATWAVANGVQILRVHDVAETVHAVRMAESILERART